MKKNRKKANETPDPTRGPAPPERRPESPGLSAHPTEILPERNADEPPAASPAPPAPPARFGHYEIIGQLGAGGMGTVYLARDTKLDRRVAVKVLNPEYGRHESNLRRFVLEAKSASALNHPNIIVIHEIGEDAAGSRYLVSEYVEGETLRELLARRALKIGEILDLAAQIAAALAAAHAARIVHRDVKPENVMVRPDGLVKVLDFGLAKLVEAETPAGEKPAPRRHQTAKGLILGTVHYMSPEQARGEAVDERTDVFSFGALVYEMLAGRAPFDADSVTETLANLLHREPAPLSSVAENVPAELERVVTKTLRKNRDERYGSMKEVAAALNELKAQLVSGDEAGAAPARPVDEKATAEMRPTAVGGPLPTAEKDERRAAAKTLRRIALLALAALLIGAALFGYRRFTGPAAPPAAATVDPPAAQAYWQMTEPEQTAFIAERVRAVQALLGGDAPAPDEAAVRLVKEQVDDYVRDRDSLSQKPFEEGLRVIYGRASQYAPLVIDAYEARRVAPALGLYQAMIESEYHDCLVSRNGNAGLFQFAPKTAEKYGLTKENRCDVTKQSEAAARLMSDLTSDFGADSSDATLGLLAFNIGENRVRDYLRQLRARGVTERSFWAIRRAERDLVPPLPDEGGRYVTRFFAAAVIGETPAAFGLSTPPLTSLRGNGR